MAQTPYLIDEDLFEFADCDKYGSTDCTSTENFYDICSTANEDEESVEEFILPCISAGIQSSQERQMRITSVFFILFATTLVFFMQAGFAVLCSGCVRKKNVQNTMLKNLLDACGSAIAFFCFGYAFAFGGSDTGTTFIGNGNYFLLGLWDDYGLQYGFWIFQYAFAATSTTIVAGTMAERCQINSYVLYSMILTGFVHSIWSVNGFLSANNKSPLWGIGMIDCAGSGVVHATGGLTALIASLMLGPRKGRFHDIDTGAKLDTPTTFPGHSKSLQILGTFILWFGWFGFNAGSTINFRGRWNFSIISLTVINTLLSAATGGLTSLFVNLILVERTTGESQYNLTYAMNGCLSGLVAIAAGCGVVEPWAAIAIGVVAGLLYLGSSKTLLRYCVDDAVDAIPVHFTCGIWGVVAVGFFASPRALKAFLQLKGENLTHSGLLYAFGNSYRISLIGCQIVGMIFICIWVSFMMIPFFFFLNYMGLLRADSLEEVVGLDVSYHGRDTVEYNESNPEWLESYLKTENQRVARDDDDSNIIDRFQ